MAACSPPLLAAYGRFVAMVCRGSACLCIGVGGPRHLRCCCRWSCGVAPPPAPTTNAQAHHVSDIVGGFLVAIIFTSPFALKAIGLHCCIKRGIDGWVPPGDAHREAGKVGLSTAVAPVGGGLGPGQFGWPHQPTADGGHVVLNMGPPASGGGAAVAAPAGRGGA